MKDNGALDRFRDETFDALVKVWGDRYREELRQEVAKAKAIKQGNSQDRFLPRVAHVGGMPAEQGDAAEAASDTPRAVLAANASTPDPAKTPILEHGDIEAGVRHAFAELRGKNYKEVEFSEALLEREIRRQLLELRLTKFYRRKYELLVKFACSRFSNLSVTEVEEAVQGAFESVFKSYLDRDPAPASFEDLQRLMNTSIRNKVLDRMRQDHGEVPFDPDDWRFARHDFTLFDIEVSPETEIAVRSLLRKLLEELPPRWHAVIAAMAIELTPQEIAKAFGRNGYVLRRWARAKICAILSKLAAEADELAGYFFARGCT